MQRGLKGAEGCGSEQRDSAVSMQRGLKALFSSFSALHSSEGLNAKRIERFGPADRLQPLTQSQCKED